MSRMSEDVTREDVLAGKTVPAMKFVELPKVTEETRNAQGMARAEFGKAFPMGVGLDFRSIPPTDDKVVKAPHGAMAVVVMAMLNGVPCRHVVDCKLTGGQHPAMVLARLCERAAKQLKVVAKKTQVQR